MIGIEKIQQCIDILTERLDFTVHNSIPLPVPLSDTLRNSILRRKDFITTDYEKAVVDKIMMVLVNSEGLAKKKFGDPSVAEAAEEDQDANLQKEQVAEEEVLKEQVRTGNCIKWGLKWEATTQKVQKLSNLNVRVVQLLGGGRGRRGGRRRRGRGGRSCQRSTQKEKILTRWREPNTMEGRVVGFPARRKGKKWSACRHVC